MPRQLGALPPSVATFGPFTLNLTSGELWKHGARLRLEGQPLQILRLLVEREGQPVSRDELRDILWTENTFVDFEHSLNAAVKRLRATLGDSGRQEIYVERLPKRGYRLTVMPVFSSPPEPPVTSRSASPPPPIAKGSEAESAPRPAPGEHVSTGSGRRTVAAGWVAILAVVLTALLASVYLPSTAIGSIVVLPFESAGLPSDEPTRYMAFGLTEALTAELSRLDRIRVVSATSARWYKESGRSLAQIAGELGTDVVVEGSVLQEGTQIRVTVQLIDALKDAHLWTHTYTREHAALLDLQLEIAQAVAREVHLTLTPARQTRQSANVDVDPVVQAAFLEGQYFASRGTEADWIRARRAFERAIAKDPAHAASYAGLAEVFLLTDAIPAVEALPLARTNALKALSLDDARPATHATLGFIAYYGDWDWAGALRSLGRAIELDPGNVRALRWNSRVLGAIGRRDEALAQVRRAAALDPVSIATLDSAAAGEFRAREFERGLAIGRRILELDANDSRGHEHVATNSALLGRYHECTEAVGRGVGLIGRASHLLAINVYCLSGAGRAEEAEALETELLALARTTYVPPYFLEIAAVGRGKTEDAIKWIQQGYAERDPYLVELRTSPWLDAVRGDPRVHDIMRMIRLLD